MAVKPPDFEFHHATRSLPIILGQFSRYSAGLSILFLIFTRFARKINTILEHHLGIIFM